MNRYMIVIPAKNRSFMLKCDEGTARSWRPCRSW